MFYAITILVERNATVAKNNIIFGGSLLLNKCSYKPPIGPILKAWVKSSKWDQVKICSLIHLGAALF